MPDIDCGGFLDGLLAIMRFLRFDVMADLIVADLERWGIMPVVATILVYRIIIEALLYKRLIRRWMK